MKSSRKPSGSKPKVDPAKRKGDTAGSSVAGKPVPTPNPQGNDDTRVDSFPFHGKRLL